MNLGHVFYGDVTGDGTEEALVYLDVHTNGSAVNSGVGRFVE